MTKEIQKWKHILIQRIYAKRNALLKQLVFDLPDDGKDFF